MVPPVEPVPMPISMPTPTIDAAKRRQLPGWIREGTKLDSRYRRSTVLLHVLNVDAMSPKMNYKDIAKPNTIVVYS